MQVYFRDGSVCWVRTETEVVDQACHPTQTRILTPGQSVLALTLYRRVGTRVSSFTPHNDQTEDSGVRSPSLPSWPSGYGVRLQSGRSGVRFPLGP